MDRERLKKEEKKQLLVNIGQCARFFLAILRIFQNFPCMVGEKNPKMLDFRRVYMYMQRQN